MFRSRGARPGETGSYTSTPLREISGSDEASGAGPGSRGLRQSYSMFEADQGCCLSCCLRF